MKLLIFVACSLVYVGLSVGLSHRLLPTKQWRGMTNDRKILFLILMMIFTPPIFCFLLGDRIAVLVLGKDENVVSGKDRDVMLVKIVEE